MKNALLLGPLMFSLAVSASPLVIYGEDNRVDVFESPNSAYVELAKSTAAMIPNIIVSGTPDANGEIQVSHSSMRENGFCAHEKFSHQTTVANCSGFLVSENQLVTAGHCVRNEISCAQYKWVFDYKVENSSQNTIKIKTSNIYGCSHILRNRYTKNNDYVVIELDRAVTDRQPLKLREYGRVQVGTPLVVIGHPAGLPTKIADGGTVRARKGKFFVANLDTYGGSSGSAVFNADTHEVEGILVRGNQDFVFNEKLGCKESLRCPEGGCDGEEITYITNVF